MVFRACGLVRRCRYLLGRTGITPCHLFLAAMAVAVVTGVPVWAEHQNRKAEVIGQVNRFSQVASELDYLMQRAARGTHNPAAASDSTNALLAAIERQVVAISRVRKSVVDEGRVRMLEDYTMALVNLRNIILESAETSGVSDNAAIENALIQIREARTRLLTHIV